MNKRLLIIMIEVAGVAAFGFLAFLSVWVLGDFLPYTGRYEGMTYISWWSAAVYCTVIVVSAAVSIYLMSRLLRKAKRHA